MFFFVEIWFFWRWVINLPPSHHHRLKLKLFKSLVEKKPLTQFWAPSIIKVNMRPDWTNPFPSGPQQCDALSLLWFFSPQQHHEKQHHEKGKHWPSCPFTIIIGTTVKVHIIMYWENPYIFIAIYTVSLNCYKYIGFIHLFQKLIFNHGGHSFF